VTEPTYPQVGATRAGDLPAGYHHLRVRRVIGTGERAFQAAAAAVLALDMHRGAGARVSTSAARVAPGVRVTTSLGLGPLRISAPTVVIWTVEEPRRAGFAYGTLPGHPASGEEAFVVTHEEGDAVVLTVTAFSNPVRWDMRAAGPLGPVLQRLFALRCAAALRRAAVTAT
jgi:uncharacterized protein (UPF0548 family)